MADSGRTFNVKAVLAGREMCCTITAPSIPELVEKATERFGIQWGEVRELMIESANITITVTPENHTAGDPA